MTSIYCNEAAGELRVYWKPLAGVFTTLGSGGKFQ